MRYNCFMCYRQRVPYSEVWAMVQYDPVTLKGVEGTPWKYLCNTCVCSKIPDKNSVELDDGSAYFVWLLEPFEKTRRVYQSIVTAEAASRS